MEIQVLIGIIISDGTLEKRGNTRFHFTQSDKHKEFFFMVYDIFKKYCTDNIVSSPKSRMINTKTYLCYTFTTKQLPCFNEYYDMFNPLGVKVVPKTIETYLTPLALAFWIMGDGSKQNEGLHLNTYGLKLEDINLLVDALNKN